MDNLCFGATMISGKNSEAFGKIVQEQEAYKAWDIIEFNRQWRRLRRDLMVRYPITDNAK